MNCRLIVLVAAVFTLGTLVGLTAFGTLQFSSLDTGVTMTRVRGKALIGGPFFLWLLLGGSRSQDPYEAR